MQFWYVLQHRWTLETACFCEVTKDHKVKIHLHEIFRTGQSTDTKSRWRLFWTTTTKGRMTQAEQWNLLPDFCWSYWERQYFLFELLSGWHKPGTARGSILLEKACLRKQPAGGKQRRKGRRERSTSDGTVSPGASYAWSCNPFLLFQSHKSNSSQNSASVGGF